MSSVYIDYKSRKPIYEQLIENISKMVLTGVFAPNELIPSVRQLASELGINPNTIHKAYLELERRGIIYSVKGRGSFVSENITDAANKQKEELIASLTEALRESQELGLTKEEASAVLDSVFSSGEKGGKI